MVIHVAQTKQPLSLISCEMKITYHLRYLVFQPLVRYLQTLIFKIK